MTQYVMDDQTVVRFEFDPPAGFQPAGANDIAGRVREAVAPAIDAARVVLDKVRQASPDEVKLKFGIKVSGTANWLIAKAATDANFEIEMTWKHSRPGRPAADDPASESV
ncbi:MAG TPA: CU044_2847 family protein [Pseudonocardiaceae bacterium]|nr:CU044_2847 family protein [Pseudonocardiaceae bacterium]